MCAAARFAQPSRSALVCVPTRSDCLAASWPLLLLKSYIAHNAATRDLCVCYEYNE